MSARKSIRFMCAACNGTGRSRYREYDDCDVCDGAGTVGSYLQLARAVDLPRLISEDNRRHSVKA